METELPIQDEKALLRKVATGDEEAFRTLYDAYRNRLYYFTLRLCSSREQAEDIVQDSFLKIWLRRELLTSVDHFGPYLLRAAQNAVVSSLRRKASEARALEPQATVPFIAGEAEQQLHIKMVKEVLQESVRDLPDQQRSVYELRREEGLKIKEIATILGISEITVKRHLTEAQKKLRQRLIREFPMEGGILLIILGLASL